MNLGLIKAIGLASTCVGMVATLITSIIDDKKMDIKIAEKVSEMIAKKG